ncbi:MAG: SAM-dependent methyltransferase [Bacteroidaceae bacterium]|nr:SAM-dependent methyltransferase [Bacteroidaceae bacterium]
MMNAATREFVLVHAGDDVARLALQGVRDPNVDLRAALVQIEGLERARRKLPSWAAMEGMEWPSRLALEQCSSEQAARYKASLVGPGRLLVDLTGGLGVDFAFMAQKFQQAVYVERQEELALLAERNFQRLGIRAEVVIGDAVAYLESMSPADVVYVDPARRDEHGGRIYDISHCHPNVVALRGDLLMSADTLMLKLSPMMDWHKAMADMGEDKVDEVHIVSLGGECKELLLLLRKRPERRLLVIVEGERRIEMGLDEWTSGTIGASLWEGELTEGLYVYDPGPGIMKAGIFAEVAQRYSLRQLSKESHLMVSRERVEEFPGRAFRLRSVSRMKGREMAAALSSLRQANVAVRGFPLTASELKRRLRLRDGGDTYIFAATLVGGGRVLLFCEKCKDERPFLAENL